MLMLIQHATCLVGMLRRWSAASLGVQSSTSAVLGEAEPSSLDCRASGRNRALTLDEDDEALIAVDD